jgi:hypothetical protein
MDENRGRARRRRKPHWRSQARVSDWTRGSRRYQPLSLRARTSDSSLILTPTGAKCLIRPVPTGSGHFARELWERNDRKEAGRGPGGFSRQKVRASDRPVPDWPSCLLRAQSVPKGHRGRSRSHDEPRRPDAPGLFHRALGEPAPGQPPPLPRIGIPSSCSLLLCTTRRASGLFLPKELGGDEVPAQSLPPYLCANPVLPFAGSTRRQLACSGEPPTLTPSP